MADRGRVWISSRQCKKKRSYHLRWICPTEQKLKSRAVGSDRKRAVTEAALLEQQLAVGTYKAVRRADWGAFAADHVSKFPHPVTAEKVRHTLQEFAAICGPDRPDQVDFSMVERYAAELLKRGVAPTTRNTKLGILKRALKKAIARGVAARNPMDGWRREREDEPEPRTITEDEERALVDAAQSMYGLGMAAFITIGIRLGARRSELLDLTWDRVDFDGQTVLFTHTKSKRDRRIPFGDDVGELLRRLQVQTLATGGPWCSLSRSVAQWRWNEIRAKVGLGEIPIKSMRKTFITRLMRQGVPPKTVQRLAGHADVKTTLRYYTDVSEDDMRQAVAKLTAAG